MNYEQMMYALNALAETSVKMRKPGDWYVSQDVEVKEGPVLVGTYGNGSTPQEAIENHWREIAELTNASRPVVVFKYEDDESRTRKHFFWNGFMWCDCTPAKKAA